MISSLSFLLFLLAAQVNGCDRCIHKTKAAYFQRTSELSTGSCGYESMALELGSGKLAAGSAALYKDGAACGSCYEIRCTDSTICNTKGTRILLTDSLPTNETDFVLSTRAFMSMALEHKTRDILKRGIVDVEYKRVPCIYNQNMALKVEESSHKDNLAVKVLYQGGQTEIVAMDVAAVGSPNWNYLSREFGAVWKTNKVPSGPLQFRFVVTSGYDGKWVWAKYVLPEDWTPGTIYSTGLQIDDIAQEGCFPCNDHTWQ